MRACRCHKATKGKFGCRPLAKRHARIYRGKRWKPFQVETKGCPEPIRSGYRHGDQDMDALSISSRIADTQAHDSGSRAAHGDGCSQDRRNTPMTDVDGSRNAQIAAHSAPQPVDSVQGWRTQPEFLAKRRQGIRHRIAIRRPKPRGCTRSVATQASQGTGPQARQLSDQAGAFAFSFAARLASTPSSQSLRMTGTAVTSCSV